MTYGIKRFVSLYENFVSIFEHVNTCCQVAAVPPFFTRILDHTKPINYAYLSLLLFVQKAVHESGDSEDSKPKFAPTVGK